jgi:hypothetical protein
MEYLRQKQMKYIREVVRSIGLNIKENSNSLIAKKGKVVLICGFERTGVEIFVNYDLSEVYHHWNRYVDSLDIFYEAISHFNRYLLKQPIRAGEDNE